MFLASWQKSIFQLALTGHEDKHVLEILQSFESHDADLVWFHHGHTEYDSGWVKFERHRDHFIFRVDGGSVDHKPVARSPDNSFDGPPVTRYVVKLLADFKFKGHSFDGGRDLDWPDRTKFNNLKRKSESVYSGDQNTWNIQKPDICED